jgi:hypothetical protein
MREGTGKVTVNNKAKKEKLGELNGEKAIEH